MKIFEALRNDHDIQRDLLKKLVDTSGDTKKREEIYKQVKHELIIHEDGEERFFYKPLIDIDMTQEHARHGIAEHHEIDELLEKLDETDMDSSAWLKYAKNLKEKVEHHLEDEEHTFFQLAGKVLSETKKDSLGSDYNNYIKKHRE
ncbi:MAG TPA: hemerythrin domain-containing protein [Flavobacteriaceae bacterium]|nr:hemerythrin domain-containing protein [Flavobacteriaceae bacterium]